MFALRNQSINWPILVSNLPEGGDWKKERESRDYKITSKRKKERKGRATRERVEEIRRREVA